MITFLDVESPLDVTDSPLAAPLSTTSFSSFWSMSNWHHDVMERGKQLEVWPISMCSKKATRAVKLTDTYLSVSTDGFGPLVQILHLSQTMTEASPASSRVPGLCHWQPAKCANQPEAHQVCEEARRGKMKRKQNRKRRKLALGNTCCICH